MSRSVTIAVIFVVVVVGVVVVVRSLPKYLRLFILRVKQTHLKFRGFDVVNRDRKSFHHKGLKH